jgi:hypothetical protein
LPAGVRLGSVELDLPAFGERTRRVKELTGWRRPRFKKEQGRMGQRRGEVSTMLSIKVGE